MTEILHTEYFDVPFVSQSSLVERLLARLKGERFAVHDPITGVTVHGYIWNEPWKLYITRIEC